MIDRLALIKQISNLSAQDIIVKNDDLLIAEKVWNGIAYDETLSHVLSKKKYPMLLPAWKEGVIGECFSLPDPLRYYEILGVDGSQVYYDRHQGPPCYLINVGSIMLRYALPQSSVYMTSNPYVCSVSATDDGITSTEYIDALREWYELKAGLELAQNYKTGEIPFLVMMDGTLLFFQLQQGGLDEKKQEFFERYMRKLLAYEQQNIWNVGYISFPKSRELVHVLQLTAADYNVEDMLKRDFLATATDSDIIRICIPQGSCTRLFQSKAPITYAYPPSLKPYFCYIHTDSEIVRLEFPAWIAQNNEAVSTICSIVYDQIIKGRGYPVALAEAHEQAVVKSDDRHFFYYMLQKKVESYAHVYRQSMKSQKKQKPVL